MVKIARGVGEARGISERFKDAKRQTARVDGKRSARKCSSFSHVTLSAHRMNTISFLPKLRELDDGEFAGVGKALSSAPFAILAL